MTEVYINESALSKEQAEDYVRTKLHLDINRTDRFSLLSDIIYQFMKTTPFQNLSMMAEPIGHKKAPSIEENVQACLQGYGGVCWTLNSFMYLLLKALQYEVDPLLCSVGKPDTNDHIAILLTYPQDDGKHWLIDTGFAAPSFRPISLNFELEGKEITESYLTYRYVKRGDIYIKMDKLSDAQKKKRSQPSDDDWEETYYFKLQPTALEEIGSQIRDNIYTNYDSSIFFHYSLRVISFNNEGKAVILKDNKFLKENENNELQPEMIEGDITATIHQQFPQFPLVLIQRAVENFKNVNKN